ncbi:cell division protein DivIVA [Bifidobacterium goeldii]|uniref:Cell division protein DivIVA n=1 Tax=Bifidobacterium goeldii TaxID=2306975 RepID=A0A430FND3_9BIFI|nr:DivIVA domain-containing protein [Bifidobacterium goeldii]RSX54342.1 cell division protein DivIVA [Bifidobacterium goeldii]
MAQKDAEAKGAGIARVGKRKWGYDPAQVDAFLDRAHTLYESEDDSLTQQDIQNVSFDLAKGGYDIAQVDAALARLEQAVVDQQTTREITDHGRVAWKARTEELYRQVCDHASRGLGERFARGRDSRPSYDRKQVDRIIDQIIDKASLGLGAEDIDDQTAKKLADVNSTSVANVIFTQRKGKRGYDERQVDFYLNVCVQLLSRLESFARVADYIGASSESSTATATAAATPRSASSVTPLFGDGDAYASAQSDVPAAPIAQPDDNPSFSELHEAEAALFTSAAATTAAADTTPAPAAAPAAAPVPPAPQPVVAQSVPPQPVVADTAASNGDASLAALSRLAGQADEPQLPSFAPAVSATPAAPAAPAAPAVFAEPAAPVAPQSQPAMPLFDQPQSAPAPETMPVSFAPAAKPQRRTGSIPKPVIQPVVQPLASADAADTAAAGADSTSAAPQARVTQSIPLNVPTHPQEPSTGSSTAAKHNEDPNSSFPNLYFDPAVSMSFDIPDLSFPTLNTTEENDSTTPKKD